MKLAAALVAVVVAARPARADGNGPPQISAPVIVGADVEPDGTGFAIGFRPEVIFPIADGSGVGPYAGIASERGRGTYQLGATYAIYAKHRAFAPSLGVYHRSPGDDGVVVGAFFGWRFYNRDLPLDIPFGVRVDAQLGIDGNRERAVVVSAQLDVVGAAALFGLVIYMVTRRHD
jgi:hypothetical protein